MLKAEENMLEVTVALTSGRNAGRLSIPQSSKVGELKALAQKALGQRFARLPGWIMVMFFSLGHRQPFAMRSPNGRAMGSAAKVVTLGGFKRSVTLFRVARGTS